MFRADKPFTSGIFTAFSHHNLNAGFLSLPSATRVFQLTKYQQHWFPETNLWILETSDHADKTPISGDRSLEGLKEQAVLPWHMRSGNEYMLGLHANSMYTGDKATQELLRSKSGAK